MDKKKLLIILIVVLVVGGGGFSIFSLTRNDGNSSTSDMNQHQSDTSNTGVTTAEAQSGDVVATISNFKFEPISIKVKKGSTVTWTNNDDTRHDVTSDSDSELRGLNSDLLAKGESYSFVFTEVGKYTYHCRPHPYMTGTVEVIE